MRICLSVGTLNTGGIGRVALNLAEVYLERGYEVDLLFTGVDQGSLRQDLIPAGARTFLLANRSRYALASAISYLKKERPDLVIAGRNNINVLMLLAHRFAGLQRSCCMICTFHTHRTTQLRYSGWRGRLYDWLMFKLSYMADYLVAVSHGVARDIEESKKMMSDSVKVIYNPAWTKKMEILADADIPRHGIFDMEVPVIVSIGRLTQEKNYEQLLCAFSRVIRSRRCLLIIIGDGENKKEIEKIIEKKGLNNSVYLLGFVENPFPYLSRSNALVLSSAWEGFGNVLVEALGFGLSIVSTDCPGGPREILNNGEYGDLVPLNDAKTMAEAILHVLDKPRDKELQKKRAQEFSAENSANQYLELYYRCTSKNTN